MIPYVWSAKLRFAETPWGAKFQKIISSNQIMNYHPVRFLHDSCTKHQHEPTKAPM